MKLHFRVVHLRNSRGLHMDPLVLLIMQCEMKGTLKQCQQYILHICKKR
jgi:hypothetical protein